MRDIAAESVRGEREGGAEGAPATQDEREREAAFRKAWEEMLVEGMNGALEKDDHLNMSFSSTEGSGKGDKADPFQSSIKKAMDKLKVAEEAKDGANLADDDDTDPLAKLLSHIGEGGAESEEDLQGLLESMMTQLMGKDVLYEPLKELHDKFPAYLKDNAATLKEEDKTRYAAQQKIVAEIIEVFEDPSYAPDNAEQGVKVVTLMNNMQDYGSPPSEIMGPLPPGLDLGPDGLPKLPEGCCIQ
ncbi:hypothetical protein PHLGIDRAFT_32078 [Phlebiopsis gigantea 11061_1 CR5-6]|uniref:Pex19 protein n=1 Tax=Phlebiopsis gigantea (strain 11061_1 CR5-6) TaxID=745531 RepID=A0A0C3NDW0_PHLG1|nr:hypothetical protein PHLGIDRAFT_32078 [Phlebiopsis gigantea 11061_1 CR5-6]